MQTITWNRRHINGAVEKVNFTRLFSTRGGVGEFTARLSVEIMARRQGLIRSKSQFMDEMDKLSLEHELSLLAARSPEEMVLAGEYFGTQAMLATVRYGLSGSDEVTTRSALKRFERFVNEVFQRSSKELVTKVS
jgi:hypothetical protein